MAGSPLPWWIYVVLPMPMWVQRDTVTAHDHGGNMKTIAIGALLLSLSVFAAPAEAVASDSEPVARVISPLAPNNAKSTLVRMQIEGSPNDWGLREFAETLDRRFVGLRVRSHGTCAERPEWACVQIVADTWTPEQQTEFAGTAFMAGTENMGYNQRSVYLNNYYSPVSPYAAAAHEFGHVLGLNHHQQEGICGAIPDQTKLSWAEDKALRPYYGKRLGKGR